MNPRIFAPSSLVAAALSSPCIALAQDTFQAEAGLSYFRFKSDNVRTNQAGVDITYCGWMFASRAILRKVPICSRTNFAKSPVFIGTAAMPIRPNCSRTSLP